ncbi:hypothetical protein FOZ60_012651 [Perkinsus olseni]|uniref:EF-hand domain-containing protein n=1 Tax=Perkinsus olseni TaxID=32597 RepID=A0A7J6P9E5_PEROL|nr:hypothetical protein FOZ60_012651 [Perkinsus olseni]
MTINFITLVAVAAVATIVCVGEDDDLKPIDYVPVHTFCDGRGRFDVEWVASIPPHVQIEEFTHKACRCDDGWASVAVRNATYGIIQFCALWTRGRSYNRSLEDSYCTHSRLAVGVPSFHSQMSLTELAVRLRPLEASPRFSQVHPQETVFVLLPYDREPPFSVHASRPSWCKYIWYAIFQVCFCKKDVFNVTGPTGVSLDRTEASATTGRSTISFQPVIEEDEGERNRVAPSVGTTSCGEHGRWSAEFGVCICQAGWENDRAGAFCSVRKVFVEANDSPSDAGEGSAAAIIVLVVVILVGAALYTMYGCRKSGRAGKREFYRMTDTATSEVDSWIRGIMGSLIEKSPNKDIWTGDVVPELTTEWVEEFKKQVVQRRTSILREAQAKKAIAEGGLSHLRASMECEPISQPGVLEEIERVFGEGTLNDFSSCFIKHADYHDTIGMRDIPDCLYWLGKNPSKRIMKTCIKQDDIKPDEDGRMNFAKFVKFMKLYRYIEDSLFNENAGFSEEDLVWFKETFDKYSGQAGTRNGAQQKGLRGGDLWNCLRAIGREPLTDEDRARVIKWVQGVVTSKEGGGGGDGREPSQNTVLDFHTFLHVVRYIVDDELEASRRRERELIARANFTDDELQGFKTVFDSLDESGTGEVPLQQMKRLFETLGLKVEPSADARIANATLKKARMLVPRAMDESMSRKSSDASCFGKITQRNMVVSTDSKDRQNIVARMRRASATNEQTDVLSTAAVGAKRRASQGIFGAQMEEAMMTAAPKKETTIRDSSSGTSSSSSEEESEEEEEESEEEEDESVIEHEERCGRSILEIKLPGGDDAALEATPHSEAE